MWRRTLKGPKCYLLVTLVANLTMSSCAGTPKDLFLTETLPPVDQIKTAVLMPLNFDHTANASLQDGLKKLQLELATQLNAAGIETIEPRMSTVMGTWRMLVKQANGESSTSNTALSGPNYLAAREELAKRMLKAHPADMVVMPTLLFREGRYSGTRLKWDSVKRPVVMTERATGASTAMIKGKDRATSVRITLFDREGHRVFERHGGIEPMTRYSMNDAFYFSEFQMKSKLRDDLFEDPWMITDGVRIALEPWLVVPIPGEEN